MVMSNVDGWRIQEGEVDSVSANGVELWSAGEDATVSGDGLVEMPQAVRRNPKSAKFFGKTLKMCQLVENGNFESTIGWYTESGATLTVANNIATITTSIEKNGIYNQISLRDGHKYLICVIAKKEDVGTIRFNISNFGGGTYERSLTTDFEAYLYVFTSNISISSTIYINSGVANSTINIKCLMLTDLTQMEQESLTAATFKTLYNKDYYPRGEYLVSNDSKWECRGKNLFDGTAFAQYLHDEYGVEINTSDRSVNLSGRILVEKKFYFEALKENTVYTFFYKAKTNNASKNMQLLYSDGTVTELNENGSVAVVTSSSKTLVGIKFVYYYTNGYMYYDGFGLIEGAHTIDDFVPYHDGGTVNLSLLTQTV